MKIDFTRISFPHRVELGLDQAWVEKVIESLDLLTGSSLKGQLELEPALGDTSCRTSGTVAVVAKVACGSCGEELVYELDLEIDQVFQPEPVENSLKVRDLSKSDLDAYYFVEGSMVDLEQLMIDALDAALPSYPSCEPPCLDKSSEAGKQDKTSRPFANLKELMIKKS